MGRLESMGSLTRLLKGGTSAAAWKPATHSKVVQIATAIIVNGKSAAEVAADIRASRYAQTYSGISGCARNDGR